MDDVWIPQKKSLRGLKRNITPRVCAMDAFFLFFYLEVPKNWLQIFNANIAFFEL